MEEKALSMLEAAFGDYIKSSISEKKLCANISTALSVLPFEQGHKNFTVNVVTHRSMPDFFGMRVFPTENENEDLCCTIGRANLAGYSDAPIEPVSYKEIVKKWRFFNDWIIEIDSLCFDRNTFAFTPRELTAMLLHEIGHVIYSDKPIEQFYRAYKEAQLQKKITDKAYNKCLYTLYMIPLAVACSQRRWMNNKNELHIEMVADKTTVDLGYAEDMVSALDKIIKEHGSIQNTDSQQQANVTSSVEWCNRCIEDISVRKDSLKNELLYQSLRSKSNYIKALNVKLMNKIGLHFKNIYTGRATEASIELLESEDFLKNYEVVTSITEAAKFDQYLESQVRSAEVAMEALINKRKKVKAILPSQYEVDSISVEIDNLQNHSDRIFVLDLIYNLLERVNTFEEAISPDPALVNKWQPKIDLMKDELQRYRKATLEKKTFNNPGYHCFVKLPPQAAAYEG